MLLFRHFDDCRFSFFGIESVIRETFPAYGSHTENSFESKRYSLERAEKFPVRPGQLRHLRKVLVGI
jgi:hypothetical protein